MSFPGPGQRTWRFNHVIGLKPVARALELGWTHDMRNRRARKHFRFYAPSSTWPTRCLSIHLLIVHCFENGGDQGSIKNPLYTIGDLTTEREEVVLERIEMASA